MAFFREKTSGNTVIMGRKTYDSIGNPLPNRKNIVLSHNAVLFDSTSECQLATSIDEALVRATQNRSREIFVIGGAETYNQFSGLVDRYLLTIVDHEARDADAFLPSGILNALKAWDSVELASYLPHPGKDQFGFKVFEISAPDAQQRSARREAMVADYHAHQRKLNAARPRSNLHRNNGTQVAFSF